MTRPSPEHRSLLLRMVALLQAPYTVVLSHEMSSR